MKPSIGLAGIRSDKGCRWLSAFVLLPGAFFAAEVPPADFRTAVDLYEAGRYTQARTLFGTLATQRPDDVEFDFYLGRLALWFDDEKSALAHLEQALHARPHEARLHNAVGDAYGLVAQNASLATKMKWANKCRAAYERAVELDPNSAAYRMSLFGYYLVAPRIVGGGKSRARAQMEAIQKLDARIGRVAWANLHLSEKNFDPAFAPFDEILRVTPDDFLALYHVGRCSALSGQQLDRGLESLRRCLELKPPMGESMPGYAHVYHRLGNILEKLGNIPAAQAEYARAMRENPDFRPAKVALKN